MFIVYLLKSESAKKGYVGVTSNLERRLNEHNSGKSSYTKKHQPWTVIHQEKFESFIDARKREKYLKSASGRRFLKQVFDRMK